ncbi:hypothetical protein QWY85_12155 [Neolewinella lacunae]|uniref:Uncharacterized protein n=1 Tax=Neolewinella lacunae TaxID=1517758 RepID=A0A923TEK8_9BACT|nr:hypothetical protein [Neolewinella lacunae]MBC6996027.1 hypothetical protein [Neolewinella lacunae]MDN3635416.1 hypothetical protein [Neolewinella lacunae]
MRTLEIILGIIIGAIGLIYLNDAIGALAYEETYKYVYKIGSTNTIFFVDQFQGLLFLMEPLPLDVYLPW